MAGRSISFSVLLSVTSTDLLGTAFFGFVLEHQGEIHTDLAGRLTLFRCPEERFTSIAAAERPPFAVVNVPGGGTSCFCSLADCINEFHVTDSLETLATEAISPPFQRSRSSFATVRKWAGALHARSLHHPQRAKAGSRQSQRSGWWRSDWQPAPTRNLASRLGQTRTTIRSEEH